VVSGRLNVRALRRLLVAILWLVILMAGGFIALLFLAPDRAASPSRYAANRTEVGAANRTPSVAPGSPIGCHAPGFEPAAQMNAATLTTLAWRPFHRDEIGWETYAPHIAQEIGVSCAPTSSGFAEAIARWQAARGLSANGQMDATTFSAMNNGWERARPFLRISQTGVCPEAPSEAGLVWAAPEEGYARKPIQLRPGALAAYRRLVAAARAASPAIAADHRLLTIFSGYRSPEADAARCARDGDCGNVTRALCSAHRTGLAMDLYLGAAPGHAPESSDDANRLYQSRSAAYAWLVANASGYGFVNYPFEPWHWEWTGEAP
jgi:D-alanyl-D-alanine carboxypeptidase